MEVEIIYEHENSTISFKDEVNREINKIGPENVIDIKLGVCCDGNSRAMIIYK